MKRLLLPTIFIIALCCSSVSAVEIASGELELTVQSLKIGAVEAAVENETSDPAGGDDFGFDFGSEEGIYEFDYKSPQKAFLYSLIIPGWGQRYAKASTLKMVFYLGVEAASWMGYFNYHNEGLKLTDAYEEYADEHWTEGPIPSGESYRDWLAARGDDESDYTHTLPDYKNQQYYEMIGKYDQFRGGWDDYWDDPDFYEEMNEADQIINISPNRLKYEQMRKDANDELDMANNFIIISVANHLISAFDAALAARKYNKNQSAEFWFSMRAEMKKYSATKSIPILRLTMTF